MIQLKIKKSVPIQRTPRVMQLEGLFDVAPTKTSDEFYDVKIPIDEFDWQIGLIVGSSGSGKTTIAREIWGAQFDRKYDWDESKSIVDSFPVNMSIKDVTMILSSVGFSSPPLWLRPYHVLSNGEKFRVMIARALAESSDEICVVDEFTSVVDRTVAKIGSAAISKTIRRTKRKFVAISCHYDIVEWLEPDWIYETNTARFARDCLRRPRINFEIKRVRPSAWELFKKYHYLNSCLNPSARCFVGFIDDSPAIFTAVLPFPHSIRSGWREHRTVCLPDFQGVGLGNAMSEAIAAIFAATDKPYFSTTSHPAMIKHRAESKFWKMTRIPSRVSEGTKTAKLKDSFSFNRLTASFEWVGSKDRDSAVKFGILSL